VKLKPCLFCGEVEAMRIQRTPGGRWYAVVCGNCWASGAYDQTRSGAARWWNGAGAAEREACAVVAEEWKHEPELKIRSHPEEAAMWYAAKCIADAIRARGEG